VGRDSLGNPIVNTDNTYYNGFIAQEVRSRIQSATSWYRRDSAAVDSVLELNYAALTPLLVEGIKAQQQTIVDLLNRVAVLEDQVHLHQSNINELYSIVTNCCSGGSGMMAPQTTGAGTAQLDSIPGVQSSGASAQAQPYLGQSVPNPTTGGALIPYEVPVGTNLAGACIRVFPLNQFPSGTQVCTHGISQCGSGTYEIQPATLEYGTYAYALFLNNQPVAVRYLLKLQN
jgi:hypothetical protein